VRDVATGHLLAAEHGVTGRRYILSGENRTMHEFMHLLAEAAGFSPRWLPRIDRKLMALLAVLAECRARIIRREPYPSFQQLRLSRYYWYYDCKRAEKELGYQCRPLRETLADMFGWYLRRKPFSLYRLNGWWLRPTRPLYAAA